MQGVTGLSQMEALVLFENTLKAVSVPNRYVLCAAPRQYVGGQLYYIVTPFPVMAFAC